jgi:GNAT superfamily N-acetyltransferase
MRTPDTLLSHAVWDGDRAAVRELLLEYWASLGVSHCFQNFDAELAGLPGDYAPPGGAMILARAKGSNALIGCVALRAASGARDACEMKRLYVRPAARGTGLGRTLALAVMREGRRIGYGRMVLDTLPILTEAQSLYLSLGFHRTGRGAEPPHVLLFERGLGDIDA